MSDVKPMIDELVERLEETCRIQNVEIECKCRSTGTSGESAATHMYAPEHQFEKKNGHACDLLHTDWAIKWPLIITYMHAGAVSCPWVFPKGPLRWEKAIMLPPL